MKIRGEFLLSVVNAETGAIRLQRKFDNMITDNGLKYAMNYTGGNGGYFAVSNGNTPPSASDITMSGSMNIRTGDVGLIGNAVSLGSPTYGFKVSKSARYAAGAINATISEIGFFNAGGLWSRQLILDDQGNPSTITVLQNEYLDVTYTLYMYPNLNDLHFQFVMNGQTYTCVSRIAKAASAGATAFVNNFSYSGVCIPGYQTGGGGALETQTLGSITGQPAGQVYNANYGTISTRAEPYDTSEPFSRKYRLDVALNNLNVPGGIGSILICDQGNLAHWWHQISFAPKLPKDENTTMTLIFSDTISRYSAP